jgi:hypothetical protein
MALSPRCVSEDRLGRLAAWRKHEISAVLSVGLGGLFLTTLDPLPVGGTLTLLFQVPGGKVRARAVVRSSVAGQGMGVQFTGMVPKSEPACNGGSSSCSSKPADRILPGQVPSPEKLLCGRLS